MEDTSDDFITPLDAMHFAIRGEIISGIEYVKDNKGNKIPVILTESGKIIYAYKDSLVCGTTKFVSEQIGHPIVVKIHR